MYSLTYEDRRKLTIEMTHKSKHSYITVFDMIDEFSKISITQSYQDFRSKFIESKWYTYSYDHYSLLSNTIKLLSTPKTETLLLSKPLFDKLRKIYPEYFVDSKKYIPPDIKTTYNNLSLTYFPSLKTSDEDQFEVIFNLIFHNELMFKSSIIPISIP